MISLFELASSFFLELSTIDLKSAYRISPTAVDNEQKDATEKQIFRMQDTVLNYNILKWLILGKGLLKYCSIYL